MAKRKSKEPEQPIRVDGTNRRSDADALEGHFVDVVKGPYTGRHASFEKVLEHGEDGYPARVLIRTRDDNSELLALDYADVAPARTRGGR